MTFMWFVAWLIRRRPRVRMFRDWNNWGIALGVSLAIDLLNGVGQAGGRMRYRAIASRRQPDTVTLDIPKETVSAPTN